MKSRIAFVLMGCCISLNCNAQHLGFGNREASEFDRSVQAIACLKNADQCADLVESIKAKQLVASFRQYALGSLSIIVSETEKKRALMRNLDVLMGEADTAIGLASSKADKNLFEYFSQDTTINLFFETVLRIAHSFGHILFGDVISQASLEMIRAYDAGNRAVCSDFVR